MSTAQINEANSWMAEQIFNKLSGMGHVIFMYCDGARVFDPAKADMLFSRKANMMVTLAATKGKPSMPEVVFNTSESTPNDLIDDLEHSLKNHNLYNHSFTRRPFGKTIEPKNFAYHIKQDMAESAWTGSTRTSRWKTGVTEVVIRHSERLMDDQSARRWCKVRDIFIHGPDGGRYRMPIKHIAGAKALAQHINHGGQAWDTQGEAILHMINVLQQCRRLRNWLTQTDSHMVPHMDHMQTKIKNGLKQISDVNHYETAMPEATEMCDMWRANPSEHAHVPEQMQAAWQALTCETLQHDNPEITTSSNHDEWPEHRELMEWFNQFVAVHETVNTDIKQAIKVTKSEDPRVILSHLSDNITGWKNEFEHNPKHVLDQITKTLEKLKKS
jgi:hypothetical protein